ncbi:unnamed protein product [Schistosoma curassoni]|uniref:Uncharacterized protein n=1 Tax=Schistosoma curassoni TaxID=6186 RepID=A0A183KG00_9TREM|nr:unnamed protein product [Schistosoma curassoni]
MTTERQQVQQLLLKKRTQRQQLTRQTRKEKVEAQTRYTEANNQVKSITDDKQKYVGDLATTAEKSARQGNLRQPYDTTKELTGNYGKPERPVKDKEGKTINDIKELNRLVGYFEELLNRSVPVNLLNIKAAPTDLSMDVSPLMIEEIRTAIKEIESEKAAESDNIPDEALKADMEAAANILHVLFRKICEEKQVPID